MKNCITNVKTITTGLVDPIGDNLVTMTLGPYEVLNWQLKIYLYQQTKMKPMYLKIKIWMKCLIIGWIIYIQDIRLEKSPPLPGKMGPLKYTQFVL